MNMYRTLEAMSTAPLGANGTYTSATMKVEAYSHLRGKVYADQAGSLALQGSDDGVTWDTLTTIAISAATPTKYEDILYTNWARIVYTNGATPQGVFRISAYKDPNR